MGDCRESNWNRLVVLCVIMLLSTLTCLKCPSASTAEFAQELKSIRHFRIDCYQSSTCSLKKKKKAAGLTAAETLKWVLLGFFYAVVIETYLLPIFYLLIPDQRPHYELVLRCSF